MSHPRSQGQLDELAQACADVARRFAGLDARVSDAQWNQRPAADEWSVAECIAHLNLSSAAMLPRMRAAIDEAKRLPPLGDRAYKGALFGRILARVVGPVPIVLGFRLGRAKTGTPFVPGSELPRAEVVGEFRRWLAEELALVWSVEGIAVDQVTLESPFVAGARYDGYSALWIVVRHELRHLVQAERALERVGAR
ncbi:MAG TPA: DinB family protein [Gemmatimonadaceae bacterium]|nr:DinB family protein [Gemmatimonadaceae bacterium]